MMQAKKFKRKLPRETSFIFKDPKKADEFYHYVNTKYQLNHTDVGYNVPITIDGKTCYLTYNEASIDDKKMNLLGLVVDAKLEDEGLTPLFDSYVKRKGHWYLIITVFDENIKNCLLEDHPLRQKTIEYLKDLKKEYLSTHNYQELLFTKKS